MLRTYLNSTCYFHIHVQGASPRWPSGVGMGCLSGLGKMRNTVELEDDNEWSYKTWALGGGNWMETHSCMATSLVSSRSQPRAQALRPQRWLLLFRLQSALNWQAPAACASLEDWHSFTCSRRLAWSAVSSKDSWMLLAWGGVWFMEIRQCCNKVSNHWSHAMTGDNFILKETDSIVRKGKTFNDSELLPLMGKEKDPI